MAPPSCILGNNHCTRFSYHSWNSPLFQLSLPAFPPSTPSPSSMPPDLLILVHHGPPMKSISPYCGHPCVHPSPFLSTQLLWIYRLYTGYHLCNIECLSVSTDVTKYYNKRANLGWLDLFGLHFFIAVHHWQTDRTETKTQLGTRRQELMQRLWMGAA